MPPPPQRKGPPPSVGRINTRKSPNYGLDLNPSAHPRTDPVNALNVLSKLLRSLPSRIGGCQYKLTPAEHALSLHLVSIIDPFVYHGARTLAPPSASNTTVVPAFASLVDQPTEILDAILFHVDSRKDLLNIGLVCKRMHAIIFPRHFDYRIIRCKVSSISVWNHLIVHKALARNVRKLEIIDERAAVTSSISNATFHRSVLIPRGISTSDTDLESTDDELRMHSKQERFLAAALLRMTGLQHFKWSSKHSPISIANVWPTLMLRATSLESVNICDNLVFGPVIDDDEGSHLTDSSESDTDDETHANSRSLKRFMAETPSHLSELTDVTFRSTSRSYGAPKQPDLGRISKMLQQCTKLKSLEIAYVSPRNSGNTAVGQGTVHRTRPLTDEFFMSSRWSYTLTRLVLTNLRCSSPNTLVTFLFEHPAIEILHFDVVTFNSIFSMSNCLPQGCLPHLREVKASKEVVNAILECPCHTPRPLSVIKGFKLSGHPGNSPSSTRSVSDATFLSNLKSTANIQTIELLGWHDMDEIRKLIPSIPNVQHLDIGKKLGAIGRRNGEKGGHNTGPTSNIIEWIDLLSTLPDLSTLHGVKFFYEVSSALTDPCELSTSSLTAMTAAANSSRQSSTHSTQMSMMERSRMRKNDEIAGVLAWKCTKLRWVDHWDEGSGRVIQLLRDHDVLQDDGGSLSGKDKVRWEVRRAKA